MSLTDPTDFDIEGGYTLRSDARRFEASTMSPALAGGLAAAADAVYERGGAWFEEIRHRADVLIGPPLRATARHHTFTEASPIRARQLRGRRRSGRRRRRTPAGAGFHPSLPARARTPTSGRARTCSIRTRNWRRWRKRCGHCRGRSIEGATGSRTTPTGSTRRRRPIGCRGRGGRVLRRARRPRRRRPSLRRRS